MLLCSIIVAIGIRLLVIKQIPPMDWEEYISEIASDIMREQSPKRFDFYASCLIECLTENELLTFYSLLIYFFFIYAFGSNQVLCIL